MGRLILSSVSAGLIAFAPPGGGGGSVTEQVRAIDAAWEAAQAQLRRDLDAAPDPAAQQKLVADVVANLNGFGKRVLDLARDHPADPGALDALLWVTHRGGRPETTAAWQILIRDHIASDRIGPACSDTRRDVFANAALGEQFLRRAIAENPHPTIRGQATYALAIVLNFRVEALGVHRDAPQTNLVTTMHDQDRAAFEQKPIADLIREAEELFETVSAQVATSRTGGNDRWANGLAANSSRCTTWGSRWHRPA